MVADPEATPSQGTFVETHAICLRTWVKYWRYSFRFLYNLPCTPFFCLEGPALYLGVELSVCAANRQGTGINKRSTALCLQHLPSSKFSNVLRWCADIKVLGGYHHLEISTSSRIIELNGNIPQFSTHCGVDRRFCCCFCCRRRY